MDIHKPKPWHGWPEFAKELVTIVLGVLIALGAEQAVETIHRRHAVQQTRAALRREMRGDVTSALLSAREDRCFGQVLRLWEGWATGGPKPARLPGVYAGASSAAWDVAKGGAVADMPLDERMTFARFYNDVANQQTHVMVEREFERHLTGYARLPKLTPQEADDFLRELAGAEDELEQKVRNYETMIETGRRLGEEPNPMRVNKIYVERIDKLCAQAGSAKADAGVEDKGS